MFRFRYLFYLRDYISPMIEIRRSRHAVQTFNQSVVLSKALTMVTMSREQDIRKIFEFVKELTLKAGETFKCGFEGEKVVTVKDYAWDLVTNYDKKIEDLLINTLKKKYPHHSFISEEDAANAKTKVELTEKPTWIIDPIDGTVNYVNGLPISCISIGLTVSKEVVLGIIYNPMTSELYTAIKGQGAFLNDEPLKTSGTTELKDALIEIELSSIRFPLKDQDLRVARLQAITNASRGARYMGSSAMALAFVARGALDCVYMEELKPWDIAAGVLLIREAGGTMVDAREDEFSIMRPNIIAGGTCELVMKVKKLIIDTDLKTMRKRLTRT